MKKLLSITIVLMLCINIKSQIDENGNFRIGYNKSIYSKASDPYKLELTPFNLNGETVFRNFYPTGSYKFYVSNGTQGESNLLSMILKGNGNVGIGTLNPLWQLTVKNSIALNGYSNQILHIRPNSGYSGYIYWAENGVSERGILGYEAGSGDLVYRSNATSFKNGVERFRISENGNIGIGINNPNEPLSIKSKGTNRYALRAYRSNSNFGLGGIYEGELKQGQIYLLNEENHASIFLNSNGNSYLNGGKIGIGTNTPEKKLDVRGNIKLGDGLGSNPELIFRPSNNSASPTIVHKLSIGFKLNAQYKDDFRFSQGGNSPFVTFSGNNESVGIGTTDPNYKLEINSPNSGINIVGANSRIYFNGNRAIEGSQDHSSLDFGEGYTNVSFRNSGNVGIGTTNTRGFKLAVKGKIGAEEIQVHAPGYWPDYVFSTDYNLKPLSEVESFIEQNNHLPDIPSEKEVKENGINLGDMDAKLLQKIEELTLYIIEQNKKIDKMQTRLEILENK